MRIVVLEEPREQMQAFNFFLFSLFLSSLAGLPFFLFFFFLYSLSHNFDRWLLEQGKNDSKNEKERQRQKKKERKTQRFSNNRMFVSIVYIQLKVSLSYSWFLLCLLYANKMGGVGVYE